MARELEAKHKVDAHDRLRSILQAEGAVRVFSGIETNSIFDLPDGSLRQRGVGLRVRAVQVLAGAPQAATLTFKGPVQPGRFKSREELEVEVQDAARMAELLRGLGFEAQLVYEKRRERWLSGACHVELDELPGLGCFVEVEGPDEAAIDHIRARLGLAEMPMIRDSYVAMVLRWLDSRCPPQKKGSGQAAGRDERALRFAPHVADLKPTAGRQL
jgi:adenylate cyclase class 2